MKGSIRFIVGFLIVFGAVGGIEQSITNSALLGGVAVALVGLAIMASGAGALKGARC